MIKDLPTDPNEKALLKTQEAPDIEAPVGIATKYHSDNKGGLIIERVADCQNVLDEAALLRSMGATKSASGDLHHVAKIPFIFIEKYCNDKGITYQEWQNNDEHITAILNDSDYKLFRVREGRV